MIAVARACLAASSLNSLKVVIKFFNSSVAPLNIPSNDTDIVSDKSFVADFISSRAVFRASKFSLALSAFSPISKNIRPMADPIGIRIPRAADRPTAAPIDIPSVPAIEGKIPANCAPC